MHSIIFPEHITGAVSTSLLSPGDVKDEKDSMPENTVQSGGPSRDRPSTEQHRLRRGMSRVLWRQQGVSMRQEK